MKRYRLRLSEFSIVVVEHLVLKARLLAHYRKSNDGEWIAPTEKMTYHRSWAIIQKWEGEGQRWSQRLRQNILDSSTVWWNFWNDKRPASGSSFQFPDDEDRYGDGREFNHGRAPAATVFGSWISSYFTHCWVSFLTIYVHLQPCFGRKSTSTGLLADVRSSRITRWHAISLVLPDLSWTSKRTGHVWPKETLIL